MAESKEKRTLFILYILGIYILFQATWWAYHLVDMNFQMFEMKSLMTGMDYSKMYQTKVWMIIGEGSIFILLLGLGFWQIKKNISQELRLARMEKTFLLSVTHELKTPIAAVKLFLETLKTRKLEPEQHQKILQDAIKEANRLETLSENILLATRLDQQGQLIHEEEFNLSDTIKSAISRYRSLFPERRINTDIQDNVSFYGDAQLMLALVSNLIENAIKYSTSNDEVQIHLQQFNQSTTLVIADQGQGIPLDERQRVFTKFYRLGNENTRKTKGTGLGLYIVKNIVKLHGGMISILSNQPKGSRFELDFPTNKSIK